MPKNVILITGTPCTGKTTTAQRLAIKLDAEYVNLTELATKEKLTLGEDKQRKTIVIDEAKTKKKLRQIIQQTNKNTVIIDGHYAATATPKPSVTKIFVLRRDPVELRRLMEKKGFTGQKLWENLASEILDVCLVDALNAHGSEKVCELDITGKTAEETANEMIDILNGCKKCYVGTVDWLGKLEKEGLLQEYLKI